VTFERLAVEIRTAFDSRHVPSPGLENRLLSAIPWERPPGRTTSVPRLAGAVAAALTLLIVAALVAPSLLSWLSVRIPGITGGPEGPAYSLASVSGQSVFVVQSGISGQVAGNVLLQSSDGGHTWTDRLHFVGVYDGMQVFGTDGFIWAIDMEPHDCTPAQASGGGLRCGSPSYALTLYRTADGGSSWTAVPAPTFPVDDAFFLDASHGWAVSGSPQTGFGSEPLYATSDGGATWTRAGTLPQQAPMGRVYGVGSYRVTFSRQADGSLRGWYIGAAHLYTSTDGGSSWLPVAISAPEAVAGWTVTPTQPAFSPGLLAPPGGQEGVLAIAYRDPTGPDNATANRIYLYVSHDGGSNWSDFRPAPAGFAPVGDIVSTSILDSTHIWLTSLSLSGGDNVQAAPAIARTSDGGVTWTVARNTPRILVMTFADPTHGYALDVSGPNNTNGIVRTSDAGATWQRVHLA
jgi:photosystem II stability/assembly factor-like uncharacterized protein